MVQQFAHFLLQPPSGLPEPMASSWANPVPIGTCQQCARLWRLHQSEFCALLVVVNTDQQSVNATVQLDGAGASWPVSNAMVMPVDPPGDAFSATAGRFSIGIKA